MSDAKKKIILNEILFWKQNKLLPEHYCDFLSTLYTEGENYEEQNSVSYKQAILSTQKRKQYAIFVSLLIVAIMLLVLLFAVKTLAWMMIIATGIVALAMLIGAIRLAQNKSLLAPFIHIIAALLILGLSMKVSFTYFEHNTIVLYCLLIGNSLLWLFSGLLLKLIYFTISGVLGLVIIAGFSVYYFM